MKFKVHSKTFGTVIVQVDTEDAHHLREHIWHVRQTKGGHLYIYRSQLATPLALHRVIADADKDEIVRFKNGDQLDIRRSNLIKEPIELARAHLAHHMVTVASLYRLVRA